jgi:hypothetical protein
MIYYWWNDGPDGEVWRDMLNPIIPSIATFRSQNGTMPIYVLDASRNSKNWGHYPFKLNFNVVPVQPGLRYDRKYGVSINQAKLLSRMIDVHNFAKHHTSAEAILFSDSDIFWVKDFFPIPEPKDGFYSNQSNNGIFYYTHNGDSSEAFRLIEEHTAKALTDKDHRKVIVDNYYSDIFNDESVYMYVRKKHPELFKDISMCENYPGINPDEFVLENAKNYHLTQSNYGLCRGLFALAIEEFYDKMKMLLSDTEIIQIFGEKNIHLVKNFKLSQLNKARLVLNSKVRIF